MEHIWVMLIQHNLKSHIQGNNGVMEAGAVLKRTKELRALAFHLKKQKLIMPNPGTRWTNICGRTAKHPKVLLL